MMVVAAVVGCSPPLAPEPVQNETESQEEVILRGARALAEAGIDAIEWGITPYLDPDEMGERYRPILDHVAARLGVPVRLVLGSDYADMQGRIVDGAVDVAVLPPYTCVQALEREPGLRVFASHIADGGPTYGAYIVSRDDRAIASLEDLRGGAVAFVDPHSTSGWLFPAARMLEAGLHPLHDVDARFLGGHDRVFDAIIAGEVDAGAVYGTALDEGRLRRSGGQRVRVIAKTRRMPHDAYVARAGFPEAASRAVGAALGEISTRTLEGRRILSSMLRINGFLPVDRSHYEAVLEVDRAVAAALEDALPVDQPLDRPTGASVP
jgi:phosphonate transport system substrate-binding protein